MNKRFSVLALFFALSVSSFAQRITYPELVYRSDLPEIFIDDLVFPADSNSAILAFTFRFNNDFLPYKKIPLNSTFPAPEDAEFYSTVRLNSEIFEGNTKRMNEAAMRSINRDFWSDTLFTKTYEETKSPEIYASGSM